jgi:urease accessory protein
VNRGALTATGRLGVQPGPERQRIRWSQAWPVVMRPTGDEQVHLVHGAGGPLGGDTFGLDVELAAGAALRVRSAGATIVQPGVGPVARWEVRAAVGAGARLDWAPEPTVVCDGAELETRLRVRLDHGAGAAVREIVVLGRYGERGGRYRGELSIDIGGQPLIAHRTVLDGADPVLCGPAGTGGARAVGTLVLAGAMGEPAVAGSPAAGGIDGEAGEDPGVRWAWTALAGAGLMLIAVGDPGAVTALLHAQPVVDLRPTTARPTAGHPTTGHPTVGHPIAVSTA